MTHEDIISKLQALKQVKPNQSWVAFSRKELFASGTVNTPVYGYGEMVSNVVGLLYQKKFAYAFAALFVLVTGSFGFVQYGSMGIPANQQVASIIAPSDPVKAIIADFQAKSNDLAEAVKTGNTAAAVQGVKDASRNLAQVLQSNPAAAKEIAIGIKESETLLSVIGNEDVKLTSSNLYAVLSQQMLEDVSRMALSSDQRRSLDEAIVLYQQEKYGDVLEVLLLISGADSTK